MAFNPAAANVISRSSDLSHSDQNLRIEPSRQFRESRFRQGFSRELGTSSGTNQPRLETLYRIQIAEPGSEAGGSFKPHHSEASSSKYVFGDYWETSLTVFSLSTFVAQLYTQMLPEKEKNHVTPYQGNEAYSVTKGIIEKTLVIYGDEANFIEDNVTDLSINIMA